jgi:quercetin dioxygenase-like cupin family protein
MGTQLNGFVKKGWGHELIWATNEKYTGKLLVFDQAGSKFSMHFHTNKDETWYVNQGSFLLRWIDTTSAVMNEQVLRTGDTWRNLPNVPHQLEALEAGSTVTEVSTADSVEDNFRIFPGDSQK